MTDTTTTLARLVTDEAAAKRLADVLAETFEAVAAAEVMLGRWAVELHLRGAPDEAAVRALVALAAGEAAGRALTFAPVASRDWVTASLAGLAPVMAGRFIVHGGHDRARVAPNRIGIEIEAALAFGTGHHGTTRGCLLALDGILKARRLGRTLDVGTGSGVLAIAAAKATRRPMLASDNDARALDVARANARLNHAGPHIEFAHAEGLAAHRFRERAPFDLVLANILLGPLKRIATPLIRLLAPNGRVVLSGLLASQANAALAAYGALALERRITLDGWATLVLVRRVRSRP